MIIVFNTETGETKTDGEQISVEDSQILDMMYEQSMREFMRPKLTIVAGNAKLIPLEQ